jgi:hypothetical protein
MARTVPDARNTGSLKRFPEEKDERVRPSLADRPLFAYSLDSERRVAVNLPVVRGLIQRRLLVNYRVRPDALQALLPPPFEPKIVAGWGMGGICLIRLAEIRPRGVPARFGLSSENAAHRIAVVWGQGEARQEGVFVRRRDTSSWVNVLAGGQLFPGIHHRADFDVEDTPEQQMRLALTSRDGATRVLVAGAPAANLPTGSVFASVAEASRFFELGSRGYSPGHNPRRYEGLELRSESWKVVPFEVSELRSSLFDSNEHFPPGSVEFDNALMMRNIPHEWHALGSVASGDDAAA